MSARVNWFPRIQGPAMLSSKLCSAWSRSSSSSTGPPSLFRNEKYAGTTSMSTKSPQALKFESSSDPSGTRPSVPLSLYSFATDRQISRDSVVILPVLTSMTTGTFPDGLINRVNHSGFSFKSISTISKSTSFSKSVIQTLCAYGHRELVKNLTSVPSRFGFARSPMSIATSDTAPANRAPNRTVRGECSLYWLRCPWWTRIRLY
mmetsp:Transcript_5263/g.12778  ORF Transcript_5263/g.12778 Transcript_5263/m.12778 type:complete len:205 (+) Transcript_5263:1432-2046(+)